MYIHDFISFSVTLSHQSIELLIVHLKLKNHGISCALFYRPPSSTQNVLLEFESTIDDLSLAKTKSLLILGDFNIDVSKGSNHTCLESIKSKHGLEQVITSPTRLTENTSTTIDHVYLSEHLSSTCHTASSKPCRRKIWLYKRADFSSANDILMSYPSEELPANEINTMWANWYNRFMTTMTTSIPSKLIKQVNNLPYLTTDLVKLIHKKHSTYKAARKLNSTSAWSKYNTMRNLVTAALRSARKKFFKNLSSKLHSPRDFWSTYHKLSSKKSRIPVDLCFGNHTACDTQSKQVCSTSFSHPAFLQAQTPTLPPHAKPTYRILYLLSVANLAKSTNYSLSLWS